MSLFTRPDPNNPTLQMCLDIPGSVSAGAPVNQHTCHGGPNQLFYFDNSRDAGFPALVHQNSGMCLGIPNGSQTPGTKIQQFPCHGGPTQGWTQRLFTQQGPGINSKYVPKHAQNPELCLSVSGEPNNRTNSASVEIASCQDAVLTNNHQRWGMIFKR